VTAGLLAAGLLLLGFVLFVVSLVLRQDALLYFPTRGVSATPQLFGLDAHELALRAEDGVTLRGWRIRGDGRRALLYFHGNAGNAGDRLERAAILRRRFGLDVYLVDYRGYGRSEGTPSEEGLYRDGRAVLRAALGDGFCPEKIVLFGESLGCAVAVELAATERAAGAVVLETPFSSIPEMARAHYPFVPRFLIRSRFDNAQRIARVSAPKLFLLAERDEVVPPAQGRSLFDLASEPKTLYVIPGAGHNETYTAGGEPYWRQWEKFLEEAGPRDHAK
jgi:fermentation-respiration switch protein FrsA (DUF1100 family)